MRTRRNKEGLADERRQRIDKRNRRLAIWRQQQITRTKRIENDRMQWRAFAPLRSVPDNLLGDKVG